jgi:type II secretion system protein N
MKRRSLYLACGIPAAILCFLLLSLFFTSTEAIEALLLRIADNAGYSIEFTDFGKAFPIGLKASLLQLSNEKGALIKVRDARLRLQILPLLTGKVRISYHGMIGQGVLEGEIDRGKTKEWSVNCKGVRLEEIPFFNTAAGPMLKGELRLTGEMLTRKGLDEGNLQLEVVGCVLTGVKIGEMPIPDAQYRRVRGAVSFEKGRAVLKSFTLEGDDIYMRLKGDSVLTEPIGRSPLNLTLEMMPKPSFLDRQKLVFLMLTKYQSSPGAFSIPIHGTLGNPSL